MYVTQKELFEELDKAFIKALMDISEKETREKGDVLFREGEPASHIYILTKGCVKLSVGEIEHPVYMANHPGEIFGWSSIVGRDYYSASAKCLEPTILRKFSKTALYDLLNRDKDNGLIFYRKLTETMGNRLLYSYSLAAQYTYPPSQGTGQLAEGIEAV